MARDCPEKSKRGSGEKGKGGKKGKGKEKPEADLRTIQPPPWPVVSSDAFGYGPDEVYPFTPEDFGYGPKEIYPTPEAFGYGPEEIYPTPEALGYGTEEIYPTTEAFGYGTEVLYPTAEKISASTPEPKSTAHGTRMRYEYQCQSEKKLPVSKSEPQGRPDASKVMDIVQRMQQRLQKEKQEKLLADVFAGNA